MSEQIQYIETMAGADFIRNPGDVDSVSTAVASGLRAAGIATKAPPSASGAISTVYTNAGYTKVNPGPSGTWLDADSGQPHTVTDSGAFTFEGGNVVRIIFPGTQDVYDILKRRPL